MKLHDLLIESNDNPAKPPFIIPELPFDEDAIPGFANGETMKLHRTVHQQAYADGLNAAIQRFHVLRAKTPLQMFDMYRKGQLVGEAKTSVEKFAGGFVNHSLFWQMLSPKKTEPSVAFKTAIENDFGSMEEFKNLFDNQASLVFGSGWTWLVYDPEADTLMVMNTSNQKNPAMSREPAIMLLGLDLWEHAFYLTHRTDKKKYLSSFWDVVNWDYASEVYARAN